MSVALLWHLCGTRCGCEAFVHSPSLGDSLASTMDNSPTQLFDSYEQDFKQIISSIRDKLEGDQQNEGGGEQFIVLTHVSGT